MEFLLDVKQEGCEGRDHGEGREGGEGHTGREGREGHHGGEGGEGRNGGEGGDGRNGRQEGRGEMVLNTVLFLKKIRCIITKFHIILRQASPSDSRLNYCLSNGLFF